MFYSNDILDAMLIIKYRQNAHLPQLLHQASAAPLDVLRRLHLLADPRRRFDDGRQQTRRIRLLMRDQAALEQRVLVEVAVLC